MKNIATASHTTSQNIEEQNNMTRSIQTAIETTGEHSRQMVSVATESNASIQGKYQGNGKSESTVSTNCLYQS